MPVSFLNPALLFGMVAGALPIIIHFLSRRRVRRQPFSDLRFLDEVQVRQARKIGLRRWLLLLLRVLAILCVALAVAGPRWGSLGTAVHGSRSLLFVIDGSASMQTMQDDGTRFEEAIRACSEIMHSLPEDAAVQIVLAADQAEPVFDDWLPAGAGAAAGLSALQGTEGGFDLAAAVRVAARQVARAPGSPVEIVLLSDLQDVGALADEQLSASIERLNSAGPNRWLVRRIGQVAETGGVLAINLPGRALRTGENIALTTTVLAEHAEQIFKLELDGLTVGEAVAPRAGVQELEFPLTVPAAGLHRGLVRKDSDAFVVDDRRPFVLAVPDRLSVLVVHGQDRPVDPTVGRGGWRYLEQTLAPGGAAGVFAPEVIADHDLTTSQLATCDVAFLVNVDPLGRQTLQGLLQWIRGGGRAVFLFGEPTAAAYLNQTLLGQLGLPATAEWRNVTEIGGERSRLIDRTHPLFADLDDAALTTLTETLWRRYFRLEAGEAVALLDLESDSPLLLTRSFDKGRLVVLPFDLLPASTDLAANPMVLPLVQRLTAWLAGPDRGGATANLLVGEIPRVTVKVGRAGAPALEDVEALSYVEDATGRRHAARLEWPGAQPTLIGPETRATGWLTCTAAADTLGVVAVAAPAVESRPDLVEPPVWLEETGRLGLTAVADLSNVAPAEFVAALAGFDLAPWLFALALLLLLCELWLGRHAGGPAPE